MALLPVQKDTFVDPDILKDTYSLSKSDALQIQKDLVNAWKPVREVWPLKYGGYVIGLACAVTSVTINTIFKRKLRLSYTGESITTFALMIGPAALSCITHNICITEDILLYKKECPLCYEVKASLLLNANAILYPAILSPILNLGVAGSLGLRIPYIYEFREISKFWWSTIRPALNHISIAFCVNSLIAGVIVYRQLSAADKMADVIKQVQAYTEKHSV